MVFTLISLRLYGLFSISGSRRTQGQFISIFTNTACHNQKGDLLQTFILLTSGLFFSQLQVQEFNSKSFRIARPPRWRAGICKEQETRKVETVLFFQFKNKLINALTGK